jgi:hypothetical protein
MEPMDEMILYLYPLAVVAVASAMGMLLNAQRGLFGPVPDPELQHRGRFLHAS